jgi:hypothetical protein
MARGDRAVCTLTRERMRIARGKQASKLNAAANLAVFAVGVRVGAFQRMPVDLPRDKILARVDSCQLRGEKLP